MNSKKQATIGAMSSNFGDLITLRDTTNDEESCDDSDDINNFDNTFNDSDPEIADIAESLSRDGPHNIFSRQSGKISGVYYSFRPKLLIAKLDKFINEDMEIFNTRVILDETIIKNIMCINLLHDSSCITLIMKDNTSKTLVFNNMIKMKIYKKRLMELIKL
jgi:hypothetical protein